MEIYARISYKHCPFLNDKVKKASSIYQLVKNDGKIYWERENVWSAYKIDFDYMFYVGSPPNTSHIQFEEWHLTKLAIRYYQYKKETK